MNLLLWYWGKRGGGAKYTLELAKTFQKLPEIKLTLSLSRQNELYKQFETLRVPHCDIDTFTSALGAITNLRYILKYRKIFKRFLREQKIDLVICSMTHVWNIFFLDILGELKIPYILVMHDAHAHPGERNIIRGFLEQYEVKRSDTLIALSESVGKELVKRFHYPEERINVVPLGLFDYTDGQSIQSHKLNSKEPIKLLFFGRILKYKGLNLLLEACLILKQKQIDFVLYIVGEGSLDPYKTGIIKLGNSVIIDNRWIADKEIYSIFHDKDIVVLPYIEASQSGVVSIAISLKIPMIATKVGGLAEQIIDGETGILVSPTPVEISKAIQGLMEEEVYNRITTKQDQLLKEYPEQIKIALKKALCNTITCR